MKRYKKPSDSRPTRRSRKPHPSRFGHESREEASWSDRQIADQHERERDDDGAGEQPPRSRHAREPEESAPHSNSTPQNGTGHNGEGRVRLRTLADLDGRTRAFKIAQRLIAQLTADLGIAPSAGQAELVQRAALLGAVCADVEANWLEGRPADLTLLGTLADRQRRILESLGLRRVAKNITPATKMVLEALQNGSARG